MEETSQVNELNDIVKLRGKQFQFESQLREQKSEIYWLENKLQIKEEELYGIRDKAG